MNTSLQRLFHGEIEMLIYQIKNTVNGKRYIGQHVGADLEAYWQRNVWLAENGYQGKRLLYRAIRKYGTSAFEVKTLVEVEDKKALDFCEILLIDLFESTDPDKGYNITKGGGGSLGVKMSQETREKMSLSRTGLVMPESHRQKLSQRNVGNKYSLGRKMTKDNFDKLMAVHIGAKRSEESKRKMALAQTGKKQSEETKIKRSLALIGRIGHTRWHVKRNKVNPKCLLCREGSNTNV
jgi:group I intron endonuclease